MPPGGAATAGGPHFTGAGAGPGFTGGYSFDAGAVSQRQMRSCYGLTNSLSLGMLARLLLALRAAAYDEIMILCVQQQGLPTKTDDAKLHKHLCKFTIILH